MSDELKEIYQTAGQLDRFFDDKTPVELFRAQTSTDRRLKLPLIYPSPGYIPADKAKAPRLPDVKIESRTIKDAGDEKGGTRTEDWVLGCRTRVGDFRGVSMFNRVNPAFKGGTWYSLAKDTDIPPGIAVLQDGAVSDKRITHFTIAPKDDMPKALFDVNLNAMGAKLVKVAK